MVAGFDRETLLDLVVNVIPLVIILFFVVAFAVVRPFGGDRLGEILMYVLLIAPFLALAVLTYLSGKAIASDERRAAVFHQGQATLEDAEPRHGADTDAPAAHTGEPHGDAEESHADAPESDAVTGERAPENSEPSGATEPAETDADPASEDDTSADDTSEEPDDSPAGDGQPADPSGE